MPPRILDPDIQESSGSDGRLGEVAILAGAGISMVGDTHLPSGPELLRSAIQALVSDRRITDVRDSALSRPGFEGLVPELMFQRINDILGGLPAELYSAFVHARPNGVHLALAAAAGGGAALATTNYDLAIEAVLGPGQRPPLHLHGSVADLSTIVHTIRAVGRGLPPEVDAQFASMLGDRRVTVVGYSGNDREVMDALLAARPRSVAWLVRSPTDAAFANIERLRPQLPELVVERCDLGEVHRAWARRHAGRIAAAPEKDEHTPGDAGPTDLRVPALRQLEVVIAVFLQLQDYDGAAAAAQQGASLEGAPSDRASIMALHAFAARRAGRLEQALQSANVSARLASDGPANVRARALTEVGLANLELEPPDVAAAEPPLREAHRLLARASDTATSEISASLLASAEQNLGFLEESRRAYAAALGHYRRALDMKRQAGDLAYEITSARDVALMLILLDREDDAEPYLARFRELASEYSDFYELANFDLELGRHRVAQHQWDDAERALSSAAEAFAQINAHRGTRRATALLEQARTSRAER